MIKIINRILLLFLILFIFNKAYCENGEKVTSAGKVIYGISQEEALKRFGLPRSAVGQVWYYENPEIFYVYLNKISEVRLYPRFLSGGTGAPLELKVFAYSGQIKEVTSSAEFIVNKPKSFQILQNNILLPLKEGIYQVVAKYEGVYSNTCFVTISPPEKKEEILGALEILPFKPQTDIETKIDFKALAVQERNKEYFLNDVTEVAKWFWEKDGQTFPMEDSKFKPPSTGNFKVFCEYNSRRSLPQEVKVTSSQQFNRYLKQISIIPSSLEVPEGATILLRVFATYNDNSVKEYITNYKWENSNQSVLEKKSNNIFVAKSAGISQLGLNSAGLKAKAKVAVARASEGKGESIKKEEAGQKEKKEQKKEESLNDLLRDIKNGIRDFKEKVSREDNFKYIRIIPSVCDIAAGEEKQFSAFGVKADNGQEDLTILGQWKALDETISQVRAGLIKGISKGQTKVCFEYKDLKSECINVFIREPKLVSINLFPAKLKLTIGEKGQFKAEGYFGDSSKRDITDFVKWLSDNNPVARIEKGKVKILKPGLVKISAELSGVKSNQAELEAVKEKYWLIKLIAKIIFFLFLIVLCAYFYLWSVIEKKKRVILKSFCNPGEFIILLYKNIFNLMGILGQKQKFFLAPLIFANLMDEKYGMNEKLFLSFTRRFEEAKYSNHSFAEEFSKEAIRDYNRIIEAVLSQYRKPALLMNYFKSLLNKTPLFI